VNICFFLYGANYVPNIADAGSVVTENRRIPSRSVVMGVPGKVIREIRSEEIEQTRSICAHYLELAQRYARGSYPPPWTR